MSYRPIRIYNGTPPSEVEAGSNIIGFSLSYGPDDAQRFGSLLVELGLTDEVVGEFYKPPIILPGETYTPDPRLPDASVSHGHIEVSPPLPDLHTLPVQERVELLKQVTAWNIDTANGSGGLIDNRQSPPGDTRMGGHTLFTW